MQAGWSGACILCYHSRSDSYSVCQQGLYSPGFGEAGALVHTHHPVSGRREDSLDACQGAAEAESSPRHWRGGDDLNRAEGDNYGLFRDCSLLQQRALPQALSRSLVHADPSLGTGMR